MSLGDFFKKFQPAPHPESRSRPVFSLDDHLPQPTEDHTIATKFGALRDFIEEHVDSFYRPPDDFDPSWSNPHSCARELEDDSSDDDDVDTTPAQNPPHFFPNIQEAHQMRQQQYVAAGHQLNQPGPLYSPAPPNDYRPGAMRVQSERVQPPSSMPKPFPRSWKKHVQSTIAKTIIDRIDPYGNDLDSFLPLEIVQFLQILPDEGNAEASEVALSEWRIRSCFLLNLHRNEKHQNKSYRRDLEENVGKTIALLNKELAKYKHPEITQDAVNIHLESIIEMAVELGILLLRQPAMYEFSSTQINEPRESRHSNSQALRDRSRRTKNPDKERTFPILLKMTDNCGKRLSRPQRVRTSDLTKKRTVWRSDTGGERSGEFGAPGRRMSTVMSQGPSGGPA